MYCILLTLFKWYAKDDERQHLVACKWKIIIYQTVSAMIYDNCEMKFNFSHSSEL